MRERVAIMLLIVGIILLFAGMEGDGFLHVLTLSVTGFACLLGAVACMLDGDDV